MGCGNVSGFVAAAAARGGGDELPDRPAASADGFARAVIGLCSDRVGSTCDSACSSRAVTWREPGAEEPSDTPEPRRAERFVGRPSMPRGLFCRMLRFAFACLSRRCTAVGLDCGDGLAGCRAGIGRVRPSLKFPRRKRLTRCSFSAFFFASAFRFMSASIHSSSLSGSGAASAGAICSP